MTRVARCRDRRAPIDTGVLRSLFEWFHSPITGLSEVRFATLLDLEAEPAAADTQHRIQTETARVHHRIANPRTPNRQRTPNRLDSATSAPQSAGPAPCKAASRRIEGHGGAAERLHLNPSTLLHELRKYAIPFGRG